MIFSQRLAGLVIAGLILVMVSGCHKNKAASSGSTGQRPVSVSAVIVTPGMLEYKIQATGSILANEEVEVRSEISGRITSIHFSEGSRAVAGSLLVKLDDTDLQAQLKKLELQEELAREDVFRKKKLLEIEAISVEEYRLSENQLGMLEAEIALLKYNISRTEIRAPFDGQIGLRYVSPGSTISSQTLVTRIIQTDPVKIEFNVPERHLSGLKPGIMVTFRIDGSDSLFQAAIYAIESRIDPNTRSAFVRARCNNREGFLIPGAFAKIEVILEIIPDALVLPSEALIPDIRGEKVCVCRGGVSTQVYVTTGIRTENAVQVTSGLNPGDTLITTGLLTLRENMKVNAIVNPER